MQSKMKDLNKNMDEVFRDKLGDFQQQPPEEIWQGIKAGIGKKPSRKILIPLWQVAAGMALVITTGSALYFLNRTENKEIALITTGIQKEPKQVRTETEKISTENQSKSISIEEKTVNNNNEILKKNLSNEFVKNIENQSLIANTNEDFSDENIVRKGFKPAFNVNSMSNPYLMSATKDEIPQIKRSLTANWDMLIAEIPSDTEEEEGSEILSFTAQVSPTYSYRDIGGIGVNGNDNFNQYESGKISYSGGLQFGIKTSDRLSFYGGVMYAQLGYSIDNVEQFKDYAAVNSTDIVSVSESKNKVYSVNNSIGTLGSAPERGYFVSENITSNGSKANADYLNAPAAILNADASNVQIEQYFRYIELPFLVRYKILDRKFGVNLLGGVSTNILVGNQASMVMNGENSKIGGSENIKSMNYLGSMGFGFDYSINKNLIFSVEPQFKYFLNSINQSQLVVNRPYLLGMFTGVKYTW